MASAPIFACLRGRGVDYSQCTKKIALGSRASDARGYENSLGSLLPGKDPVEIL